MGELYQITFPNGKSYVGITRMTAARRFSAHVYQRRQKNHALYKALAKYGSEAATVTTLVIGEWAYLAELEKRAIVAFGTKVPHGYNMTDGGEVPVGLLPESLARIGAGARGNTYRVGMKHSPETRAMMSQRRRGKPKRLSDARRAALRTSMLGNTFGCGRKLSEDHKAAISAANSGKVITEDTRERMRCAAREREAAKRAAREHAA